MTMPEERRTCGDAGGVTLAGGPCRSFLGLSETTGLCLFHDPERQDEATAVARSGAVAKNEADRKRRAALPEDMPTFRPNTLERVALWHQWTIESVACGRIDGRTAGEVTRALKELRPTLERMDYAERFKEVEAALKKAKKRIRELGG